MTRTSKSWQRVAEYAIATACFQGFLGFGVFSTMYGRGPLVLFFLLPMVNIAYQWLGMNAYRVEFWPSAIFAGTIFMFFVVSAVGEFIYQLKMWASRIRRRWTEQRLDEP